jgi:hypothetical protein
MPLPDHFDRLPPEVQQEMRDREKQQRLAAIEYDHRMKSRRWSGAMIAAAGAALFSYIPSFFLPISDAFIPLAAFFGGVAGWLTVHNRYAIMGGMMLVGIVCIAGNFVGYVSGLCPPLLVVWPLYIGVGAFVGIWAQGKRHAEDAGF